MNARMTLHGWVIPDEMLRFATAVNDTDALPTTGDLLLLMEKPWKWEREYEAWKRLGEPTSHEDAGWDDFVVACAENA